MRTTQKDLARLNREVREFFNVRKNSDAWKLMQSAVDKLTAIIAQSPEWNKPMVTPYADNTWKVFCVPTKDSRYSMTAAAMPISTDAWLSDPERTAADFLSHDWPTA